MSSSLGRFVLSIAALLGSAAAPNAQTTGVPFVNDYTVNGLTSGSVSCPFFNLSTSLPPIVLQITTAPSVPVVFLFNVNCPCTPCVLPLPIAPCAVPLSACGATTNQSFDLNTTFTTCVLLSAPGASNAAGVATLSIVPPPLLRFGTQAAALHPCSTAFPALFTQGYQIST